MVIAEKLRISEQQEIGDLFDSLKARLIELNSPGLKHILTQLNQKLAPPSTANSAADDSEEEARRVLVEKLSGGVSYSPEEIFRLEVENFKLAFEFRRHLLEGALTASQVGKLLGGKSRQMAHDRRTANKLIAIFDKGRWMFPLWQFDASGPDGVLPGLPEVLAALDSLQPLDDLDKAGFLTTPNPALGGATPVDYLRLRKIDEVVSAAYAASVI